MNGFIVGVLTTCLVAIGAYVYLTKTARLDGWTTPGVPVVSRVVPPKQVVVPPKQVIVPPNQVVDAQGFVDVICEPAPGAAGYTFRARLGQTVTCNNGATPSF